MPDTCVLGIDLGTAKCGVCWVNDTSIALLKTYSTDQLIATLTDCSNRWGTPAAVVIDAPIDPTGDAGFRLIDRVFMRGLFNNNFVGLQPNNPDLLNLLPQIEALREWCQAKGVEYSNEFPGPNRGILRETMPNVALGIVSQPFELLSLKKRLRFKYGRGSNIAPIIVGFEAISSGIPDFLAPILGGGGGTFLWEDLEQVAGETTGQQSDDLISGLVCAALAWWCVNTDEVGYVSEPRGHYVLPPRRTVFQEWLVELNKILASPDFAQVHTNLVVPAAQ